VRYNGRGNESLIKSSLIIWKLNQGLGVLSFFYWNTIGQVAGDLLFLIKAFSNIS